MGVLNFQWCKNKFGTYENIFLNCCVTLISHTLIFGKYNGTPLVQNAVSSSSIH